MEIFAYIKTALLSINKNKLRSFLTMFGIIIGICSTSIILAVGEGLKINIDESLKKSNVNTLTLSYIQSDTEIAKSEGEFTKIDIDYLKKEEYIENAELSKNSLIEMQGVSTNISYFNNNISVFISPKKVNDYKIILGRDFNNNDENNYAIINLNLAKKLFGNYYLNAINKGIKCNGIIVEVIGIFENNLNDTYSYKCFVTNNVLKNIKDLDKVNYGVSITYNPNYNISKIKESIIALMKKNNPEKNGEYTITSPTEVSQALKKIVSYLTFFIASVSGISLFVSGVGIMNIMYVSVSERKKEIGIKRAIGAQTTSIIKQFLTESLIITQIAGGLGIIISYIIIIIISKKSFIKPQLSFSIIAKSTFICTAIGVCFGIIPAIKAANLNPLDAIRD